MTPAQFLVAITSGNLFWDEWEGPGPGKLEQTANEADGERWWVEEPPALVPELRSQKPRAGAGDETQGGLLTTIVTAPVALVNSFVGLFA